MDRTTLDYEILPDFRAKFLSLTVDPRLNDIWSMRFGLGQPLNHFSGWNVTASTIMATRYGDLALTGDYDNTDSDWRVAAQWSFGLGWDPVRRDYDLMRSGPGTGGPSVSTPPQRLDLRPRSGSVARIDFPMRPTGGG